jgi:hypothetical protein
MNQYIHPVISLIDKGERIPLQIPFIKGPNKHRQFLLNYWRRDEYVIKFWVDYRK